ncbi:DUF1847 domain-containing protein [Oscillospiraceae bacterium OttesenSCG-928-G22]|nr:DUF1847 domain-containing protein [Oscillospiraceae bacterium OttesenSCG-928-G22]
MYTCATCAAISCDDPERKNMPKNCPMRETETNRDILKEYEKPENHDFFLTSAAIEALGYCEWPRLREIAEFSKRMGYKKLGMAFCRGLQREARTIQSILEQHGLEVLSVICKTGAVSKEMVGVPEEHKLSPGEFEAMCNPIAQATFLNTQKTDLNIVVGLCVGHDSLFYKYSDALVTTLIAKDRVLAHNPAGAVYCSAGYARRRLAPSE